MESMISLELHAVETDNVKLQIRTKAGPSSLYKVLNALRMKFKAVKLEANSKNVDNMIRSKREIFLARKQKNFDEFNEEIEGMLFAMSDASSTVLEYHKRMQKCKAISWRYLQESEARIAIQKDKLILRLTGFARSIVDDMHEKKGKELSTIHNLAVYKLQQASKMILSAHIWPTVNFLSDPLKHLEQPIILLHSLRFLETVCSKSTGKGKLLDSGTSSNSVRTIVESFRCVVAMALTIIRDWTRDPTLILTVFSQAIHTLAAVLNFRVKTNMSFPRTESQKMRKTSTSSTASGSSSIGGTGKKKISNNEHHDVVGEGSGSGSNGSGRGMNLLGWDWGFNDYTDETLCGDLILWLRILERIIDPPRTVEKVTCSSIASVGISWDTSKEHRDSIFSQLSGHVGLGSPLRSELLYCASTLTYNIFPPPVEERDDEKNPTAIHTVVRELASCVLVIAQQSSERYAVRLGQVDCPYSIGLGDIVLTKFADEESIVAFNSAANAFGLGRPSHAAVRILKLGHVICRHRIQSFFVVSAWLKCILSAAMYVLASQHSSISRLSSEVDISLRKECIAVLTTCTFRVMVCMCVHRHSLSIVHLSMLTLRALFRDLFQKRHIIEDYCERSMLAFAQPLTEFSTSNIIDEDKLADEQFAAAAAANNTNNNNETNNNTNDTTTTTTNNIDTNSSSTVVETEVDSSSGSGGVKTKVSEVKQWKKDNVVTILQEGQVTVANFKFADLLHFIGETHIQSSEVMEQLLLMIDHISFSSQLCKYLIIDTGMPLILQRILSMYSSSSDVYLIALIELCISLLDI